MAQLEIKIDSIFDGIMPSALFGEVGQFQSSLGIDPDMPRTDDATDAKAAGIIRPVHYEKFSGSLLEGCPIAIITNPKDSYVYVVTRNGLLVRYDSDLENEALVGTTSTHYAEGGFYYNNYIYITTLVDVCRYGPLDGTAAFTNNVWTGSTLGNKTGLVNNNYPSSLLGVSYLKHYGISHLDGSAYFLDYSAGVGYVHKIETTASAGVEGAANVGSDYGLLDLPKNYLPITLTSYGNDLAVAACLTNNSDIIQGGAALFLFNPADTIPSFYRKIPLPDSLCSVLWYNNGFLNGLSGDINGGYRLFEYAGGDTIQTLKIIEEGNLPLQGAAAAIANRLVWAADNIDPATASGLYGYASKSDLFSRGLHHVAISAFT